MVSMWTRTWVARRESPSAKKSSWIPDLFDLQDGRPDVRQLFLRDVRGATKVRGMTLPPTSPSVAANPTRLTLPVGPFGELRDDEHLAWNLELGDAGLRRTDVSFGVAARQDRRTTAEATSSPAWHVARQKLRVRPPSDGPAVVRRVAGERLSHRRD